ncbi:hypothetical protein HanPI659440_Chr01g0008931 [Helianthus annuus]|nr:hypothetical protein HanPI659440_Chr01g0008931 [Helianthus annuus]
MLLSDSIDNGIQTTNSGTDAVISAETCRKPGRREEERLRSLCLNRWLRSSMGQSECFT